MKSLASKLLPKSLKDKITGSDLFTRRQARALAASSKRIDICSAQFAHILHLAKHPPLEGKICLEVGAGWVLTHALVCYLLGAQKVIATDITHRAHPEVLTTAVSEAVDSIPRDILAPFSNHAVIRERFDRLTSIRHYSFEELANIGIEYSAGIDLARTISTERVDFIYSFSVLEHVPVADVRNLLENLVASLNPGGTMLHCIHLEDHRDFDRNSLDFLGIASDRYTRELETNWGNRIRMSEWEKVFENLAGTRTELIYTYLRADVPLPTAIDPSIKYRDEIDLRTSHLGVYTRKSK